MAKYATLEFEARIKRDGPYTVVATMTLTLADPSYGQGAIDGMMEVLAGWERADPTIQATQVAPRLDTLRVE